MQVVVEKRQALIGVLLICLVPFFSGGRHVSGWFLVLGLLVLGLYIAWRSQPAPKLKWNWWTIAFGLFGVWSALSLVWSVNRYQTLQWVLFLVAMAGAFHLARRIVVEKGIGAWMAGYVAVATLVSLWGLVDYLTPNGFDRLTSTFNWPNPFAIYVLPAIIIAGSKLTQKLSKKLTAVWAVAVLINLTAFLLAASRTSLLLLVLVALVAVVTMHSQRVIWRWVLLAVASAGLMVGISWVRVSVLHIQTSPNVAARLAEAAQGQSVSASDRLFYLQSSWDIWKSAPIQGTGAGTFGTTYPQFQHRVISATTHTHNLYAQVFAELGLVGGLLLVVMVVGLLWQSLLAAKAEPELRLLAVCLAVLLVHQAMDIDSLYLSVLVLAASLAGFIYRPTGERTLPGGGFILTILVVASVAQAYAFMLNNTAMQQGANSQDNHDFAAAAADYDRANLGLWPDPAHLNQAGINYYTEAQLLIKPQANLAVAAQRAREAIRQDPKTAAHYFLLARVSLLQGDLKTAEANYLQTLHYDPYNNPDYYSDLAQLYLRQNNLSEADKLLHRAEAQYDATTINNRNFVPNFAQQVATLFVEQAYLDQAWGRAAAVAADLTKAGQIDPKNPSIKYLEQHGLPQP